MGEFITRLGLHLPKYPTSSTLTFNPLLTEQATPALSALLHRLAMSSSLIRVAVRGPTQTFFRAYRPVAPSRASAAVPALIAGSSLNFSTTIARRSEHHEETFEEFTAR